MKQTLLTTALLITAVLAFAQAPQGINYQAVVRDAGGDELVSQAVSLRMTILENNTTTVYQETHSATTNDFGLVNLVIGQGTATQGTFNTIDWSTGNYFAQTEVDVSGGTNYSLMGSQQLMSVPYALYAKNTDSWTVNADTTYTTNWVGIVSSSPNAPLYVGGGPSGDAAVRFRNGFGTSKVLHLIEEQGSSGHYGLFVGASDYSDAVLVTKGGQVGIRTTTPQRELHVNNVMRLEPRASAPSSPAEGDIYMNSTTKKLMVYDGTVWQACW
ncbi:hypothetical protein OAE48_01570 [Flavobacteriales bacterium]|nr:hypothetical protein [Flavobacteriales bacterium]